MAIDDFGLPDLSLSLPRLVKKRKTTAEPDEEGRRSLLGRIGDASLSGLSMVGNALDLPGSMVRDTISGHNPFDQLLSPLSDRNRQTGRDVLRTYGLAGKKDTWGNWGAGLGAEIALDPMTYLTFGLGALGKGGKVAKAAGLIDDAARVGARRLGVEASQVGARQARVGNTLRDLIQDGGMEAARKARDAAKAQGLKLRDIADEPLGGLMGVGMPFQDPSFILGTGKTGQAIAKGLDSAGRAVQYATIPGTNFQPINAVARMFDARLKDTATPEVQTAAKSLTRAQHANEAAVNLKTTERMRQLDDIGMGLQGDSAKLRELVSNPAVGANLSTAGEALKSGLIQLQGNRGPSRRFQKQSLATIDQWLSSNIINDQDAIALRRMVEYRGLDAGAGAAEPIIKGIRQDLEAGLQGSQKLGNAADRLSDTQNAYFPASMTEGLALSGKQAEEIMGTAHANREGRRLFTRDIRNRENVLNQIAADPVLGNLIDQRGADVDTISRYLKRTYSNAVPATFVDEYGNKASRFKALAGWYANMPKELREAGIYGNHPLQDLAKQQLRVRNSDSAAKTVFEFLSQPGILKPATTAARDEGHTTVSDVFRKIDLNEGDDTAGALKSLADLQKTVFSSDLGKQRIPQHLADDLTRMVKGFASPEPANQIVKVYDSVTNLTKGMLTGPWPAFQIRNLVSGQWQNFIAGIFSPGSVSKAHNVIRGGVLKGAADLPAVRKLARDRGIPLADKGVPELVETLKREGNLNQEEAEIVGKVWQAWSEGYMGEDVKTAMKKRVEFQKGGRIPKGALKQGIGETPEAWTDEMADKFDKLENDVEKWSEAPPDHVWEPSVKHHIDMSRQDLDRMREVYEGKRRWNELTWESRPYADMNKDSLFARTAAGSDYSELYVPSIKPQKDGKFLVGGGVFNTLDEAKDYAERTAHGIYFHQELGPDGKVLDYRIVPDRKRKITTSGLMHRTGSEADAARLSKGIIARTLPESVSPSVKVSSARRALDDLQSGYASLEESFEKLGDAGKVIDPEILKDVQSGAKSIDEAMQSVKLSDNELRTIIKEQPMIADGIRFVMDRKFGAINTTYGGPGIKKGAPELYDTFDQNAWNSLNRDVNLNPQLASDVADEVMKIAADATAFGPHEVDRLLSELTHKVRSAVDGVESHDPFTEQLRLKVQAGQLAKAQEVIKKIPNVSAAGLRKQLGDISTETAEELLQMHRTQEVLKRIPKVSPAGLAKQLGGNLSEEKAAQLLQNARQPLLQMDGSTTKGAVSFAASGKALVQSFKAADVSTHLHEFAHTARRNLTAADQQIASQFVGATGSTWTRDQEELFARGFENYIRTGQAPTSAIGEMFNRLKQWMVGIYQSIAGTPIDVQLTPEIKELYGKLIGTKSQIKKLDDETGTKLLRELAASWRITGKGELDNAVGQLPGDPATIDSIRAGLPGEIPHRFGNALNKLRGKGDVTWNPLEMRGFNERTKSRFAPAAAGDEVGYYVEGLNRLAPFIEQLEKGVDPAEAAKKIGAAQVLYQNKYYTKTEQEVLARLFPFYKFTSRQLPFTLQQLSERPGGRMAQTIRAANRARDPDEFTPDYVAETASIPLGKSADGTARYLTGLGLSMEDPLSLVGGPRSTVLELLSRLNPLIKAPLEYATGESFFQKGPEGGRNLSDMDPTIGRLLANVSGRKEPVRIPFGQELDVLLNNSPLSRVASSARVLTDGRKGLPGKAANLLTGFKVSDISPGAQDAVLRERSQALEKQLGGREFVKLHFPEEVRETMSPEQLAMVDQLLGIDHELAMRAKKRKLERQKQEKK
jgi:hypothetical protein